MMSQVLISISTWLHALATVIFIGHFILLALIYLPALAQSGNGPLLSAVSRRSRPWMYVSLVIFLLTGVYLMIVDPSYQGVGNFGNFWAIMMLVKHMLVLGMIAIGFWFNAILRVGPMMSSTHGVEQARARFRTYVSLMAATGILVLLLTALAQAK